MMPDVISNCKKATELVVKTSEGSLSWKEKLYLQMHLLFCVFCRRFVRQNKAIDEMLTKENSLTDTDRQSILNDIAKNFKEQQP